MYGIRPGIGAHIDSIAGKRSGRDTGNQHKERDAGPLWNPIIGFLVTSCYNATTVMKDN